MGVLGGLKRLLLGNMMGWNFLCVVFRVKGVKGKNR